MTKIELQHGSLISSPARVSSLVELVCHVGPPESRNIERTEHKQNLLKVMPRKVEGEKDQRLSRKAVSADLTSVEERVDSRKKGIGAGCNPEPVPECHSEFRRNRRRRLSSIVLRAGF